MDLRARRIHDARHAAIAIAAGVRNVYTYDIHDWNIFETNGLIVTDRPAAGTAGAR